MAKKTTPKSNPPAPAKPAAKPPAKSAAKPKAAASALPKEAPIVKASAEPVIAAILAPAPVLEKPVKTPKTAKVSAAKPTEPKTKKATSKKVVAPAKVGKSAPAPAAAAPVFTRDDVALRAYFISEKRRSQGLPGNEHQDWLEAERQIAAECAAGQHPSKV